MTDEDVITMYKFKKAAVGATFDHLHAGHKAYLDVVFELADKVVVGVTSDDYVQKKDKKFKELIQTYEERRSGVESYLYEKGYVSRTDIQKTDGRPGEGMVPDCEAIFVSDKASHKFAGMVNELRKKNGMTAINIIEIEPVVFAPDGERISSTRIRRYLKYHNGK